jgi:two-component system sensor histidine kinase HupT/HoxJ
MISNADFILAVATMVVSVVFGIKCIRRKRIRLIHKLYFITVFIMFVWLALTAGLRFLSRSDGTAAYVIDSFMHIGGFTPPLILLISIVFIRRIERPSRRWLLLFIIPMAVKALAWTNPLHHLYYRTFSILAGEVVFGPMLAVSAIYSYACFIIAIIWMLYFAVKSKNRIQMYQALLFTAGDAFPMAVSLVATLQLFNMSIVSTPLSFGVTIILHGIAIFYFHMLDLKPIAIRKVLDWTSDGYLVLSDNNLVVHFNQPFYEIIGKPCGIRENMFLQDCVRDEDVENRAVINNLLVVIDTCREEDTGGGASYEQSIFVERGGEYVQQYYMVEVTSLRAKEQRVGFVAIFKDVTKIKESMEKLQANQARMMEQERLVSLGHLIGGIAHNLKTPIMSISGGVRAIEELVEESSVSIGDPEVTKEDYLEIYGEMTDWIDRIRQACAYMSDMITAVKGQTTKMSSAMGGEFTIANLFKQVFLLLRHELQRGGCTLEIDNRTGGEVFIRGDINNMVQVINNLVSNAVDAMHDRGGGKIEICVRERKEMLDILVKDTGTGVPPEIREKLFHQMVTNKGARGTGLGVFISHSVIKANFDGSIWLKDNPDGGSIFGISIPIEYIKIETTEEKGAHEKK